MGYFNINNGFFCVEHLKVEELAKEYGTPLYIYSKSTLIDNFRQFKDAFGNLSHLICYAVKANSNIAILNLMSQLGAGFDIVSGGELARVIKAGGDPSKVIYSGVAKSEAEITFALNSGIKCFNIESEAELERINKIAITLSKKAPISIRVNPDVDAGTHPYISTGLKKNKFGVSVDKALNLYLKAQGMSGISIDGIDCHIGSQLTTLAPFKDAIDRLLLLIETLKTKGIQFSHIDVGGGLGVVYNDEVPPSITEYVEMLKQKLEDKNLTIICEPGRSMVANSGILVSKCEYLKEGDVSNFCIVDTAMNDMIRPSLYEAWMKIEEANKNLDRPEKVYDVVGPICETGDFLGKSRKLKVSEGDYLVMRGAGAYGFAMSSNYNSRPRAMELLVSDSKVSVIRERENIEDLFRLEKIAE
jgi:diaminopimelate decarboxylase